MNGRVMSLWIGVLAASVSGCANTIASAMGMNRTRPIEDTRTARFGVCSYADTGSFIGSTGGVKACARTRDGDGSGAFLLSEFTSTDDARANPGNWRLVLADGNGRVLLDATFPMVARKPSFLETLSCFLSAGCITIERRSDALTEPWARGTYKLTYTYVPDQRDFPMVISLE